MATTDNDTDVHGGIIELWQHTDVYHDYQIVSDFITKIKTFYSPFIICNVIPIHFRLIYFCVTALVYTSQQCHECLLNCVLKCVYL